MLSPCADLNHWKGRFRVWPTLFLKRSVCRVCSFLSAGAFLSRTSGQHVAWRQVSSLTTPFWAVNRMRVWYKDGGTEEGEGRTRLVQYICFRHFIMSSSRCPGGDLDTTPSTEGSAQVFKHELKRKALRIYPLRVERSTTLSYHLQCECYCWFTRSNINPHHWIEILLSAW